ncbi:MAG: hypothetical protein MI974_13345 [Chitinophagales bacterium]|nr:hypothetical protein [Chitinophagales bacterium]
MKSINNKTANFYSIEMNKTGEELVICYWCFDTLKEAKAFLNGLKMAVLLKMLPFPYMMLSKIL